MISIDREFEALIPALTEAEHVALSHSLRAAGRALDPIKVWTGEGIIVDGHNRYRICTEHELPYEVQELEFADRAAAKAWMLDHQSSRRNLSRDQQIMLRVMHGAEPLPRTAKTSVATAHRAHAAGYGDDVLSGKLTLRMAKNRITPKAPRGPKKRPEIPQGHELAGVSTLSDGSGVTSAQWNKTRIAGAEEAPHEPVPEGHLVVQTSTMLRGDGTTSVQWVKAKADEAKREQAMRDAWARHAQVYAGAADPTPSPTDRTEDIITLYPLGDPHIGMLSWEPETGDNFDTEIAVRELLACVRLLVGAGRSEHAIICNLGDFLHAQNDSNKTPGHGNELDVDGRYAKVLDAGHALLRGIVDAALAVHETVTIRNLPGNHDPRVAAELAMWLRAVYEREPRVIVPDAYASQQYDRFGKNLFGWHHGDRARATELPAIMATDRAEDWGQTTERVWHVGHIHHLTKHEHPGCVVESHRTMAAKDAWHAGRYRAGRSLVAIEYHREFGEISRSTRGIECVREALKGKSTQ